MELTGFHKALASRGLSAGISPDDDIYGWLIGSWKLRVMIYQRADLSGQEVMGEVHFGRVLEGRAIQDVWILSGRMYGTTIRIWDPSIAAWRITWINPLTGHSEEQVGRRVGANIVQVGGRPNGTPTRWRFTEMTQDSFHWIGDVLEPDGSTWCTEGEFLAVREK